MSEGSQVSKVTLCVKILKWHSPTPRSGIELPGQLKINYIFVLIFHDTFKNSKSELLGVGVS